MHVVHTVKMVLSALEEVKLSLDNNDLHIIVVSTAKLLYVELHSRSVPRLSGQLALFLSPLWELKGYASQVADING